MAQDPVVEEGAAEAPKKSKKKLIIIIAAVLVLAIGGGGAAWFFMHKSADHKGAKEVKKEEEHKEPPAFVKLETFTVNLTPEGDSEKFLQVDISLKASGKEESEQLEALMPQVRNRILMTLTSQKASEISSMEGKKALSNALIKQVNQPYDKDGKPLKVSDVLFTSFVIQ